MRRVPAHALLPLLAATLASVSIVGADARWLAAVGALLAHGHLPRQLPFAAATTTGWHDVPVLAELIFHWLYAAAGDRGFVVAQVCAAALGFGALAYGLGRRASPAAALLVGLLVLVGSLPEVLIARSTLFSLALFPVLLLVLHERGDRLWLALPLLAIWSNLHGAVLVGIALVWVYVAIARRDAWWVAVLAPIAACVTPQLWHTPQYYVDVSRNEAAARGVGLWQPLGASIVDVFVVVVALALLFAALAGRRRWTAWEAVAVVGLAAATVHASRFGPWLLMTLAYPAASALRLERPRTLPAMALALPVAATVAGLVSSHAARGHVLAARAAASGRTVLAEPIAAEVVEVDGGRVWVADPLDAFPRGDQRIYLDWSEGKPGGRAALAHASLVLVRDGSAAGRASAGDGALRRVARGDGYTLYRVAPKARR